MVHAKDECLEIYLVEVKDFLSAFRLVCESVDM